MTVRDWCGWDIVLAEASHDGVHPVAIETSGAAACWYSNLWRLCEGGFVMRLSSAGFLT